MVTTVRRTAGAAVASGVLMALGVEGEWLWDAQRDDGTVTDRPVLAVLMTLATAGFVLLLVAARGLRAHLHHPTRAARVGAVLTSVGAGSLVLFGAVALLSLLASGAVLEASFIAFLVGLLLLSVGPVTWGLGLRRRRLPARGVWLALVAAGVAAFLALAVEPDPWHDLALVAMCLSWSGLGLALRRRGDDDAAAHRRGTTTRAAA